MTVYLGDTELQRARRVAIAYRQHLRTANPGAAAALDDAVTAAGEGWWLVEQEVTVDPDDLLSTADAAQLASVRPGTVRQWRKRGFYDQYGHHRRLTPAGHDRRGWPQFRAADILAAAAATRHRRQRRTT